MIMSSHCGVEIKSPLHLRVALALPAINRAENEEEKQHSCLYIFVSVLNNQINI